MKSYVGFIHDCIYAKKTRETVPCLISSKIYSYRIILWGNCEHWNHIFKNNFHKIPVRYSFTDENHVFSILITKWCFSEEMRTAPENNGLQGVKIQTDLFSNASPSPNSQKRRKPAFTRTIEHYFSNLYCNLALKVLSSNWKDQQSEFTETLAHKQYFRFSSRLFKMETCLLPNPHPLSHKIRHQALPDQGLPASWVQISFQALWPSLWPLAPMWGAAGQG